MTKLIPFDRAKYEKGSKVVRRDGKEVLQLFFSNACNQDEPILQIFRLLPGDVTSVSNCIDGLFDEQPGSCHDLFLEAETIDFYIGISKNGLTSQAFMNKEDVRQGWDAIVKVSLDADTFEQV